jgi:chromosome segregation ATPase
VEETTSDKVDQDDKYRAELAEARRETSDARRALEMCEKSQSESSMRIIELERKNVELRDRLERRTAREEEDGDVLYIGDLDPHGRSLEEVVELRRRVAELESANSALVAQASAERSAVAQADQLNVKEVTNLRNMLRARDDAIQSLQARVERGDSDMTELERELDELREDNSRRDAASAEFNEERSKGDADRIDALTEETGELKILIDKQNQALKDMTAKWEKQREEYREQCILAERRGEEIDVLKSSLLAEESKRETLLETLNASLTKVTNLEMELQMANERVDELTSALNEAAEEVDELHAEMVFKGGRIESLEKEIQDASSLREERAASSTIVPDDFSEGGRGEDSGSNFGRLREEIRRVSVEKTRLESEHAHQLSRLASVKDGAIAALETELDDVRARLAAETETANAIKAILKGLEATNAELSAELAKTRQVMDQLDAEEDLELEETRQMMKELQAENIKLKGEIEGLRMALKKKEQDLLGMEINNREELLKAQEALDREKKSSEGVGNTETIDSFKKKMLVYEERVRRSEAKFGQTVREKDMVISDLKIELLSKERYSEDLRRDLESLQLIVESAPSKRNYGMAIDPEWHEPDTISKLKVQVSTLMKDKNMIEAELRTKIESRDATVSSS